MEYLFGASASVDYDIEGVVVEECSAAVSVNKPVFIGATPFVVSCSVVRFGQRDIAPAPVERAPGDFLELARCLGVRYPGSIVPPAENLTDARCVNRFLRRILKHEFLRSSKLWLEFVLHRALPKAMYSLELAGSEFSMTTSTARITGSVDFREADESAEEPRRVLEWAKEKETLLEMATQKAKVAAASLATAAKDASALLAAGGILVDLVVAASSSTNDEDFDDSSGFSETEVEEKPKKKKFNAKDPYGVDGALAGFADEKAYVQSLKTAASHVKSVFERLAVAKASLKTHETSYAKRRNIDDPNSTSGSMTLATASTKKDVELAKKKAVILADVCAKALKRFADEARTFIRDFPQRYSDVVNDLMDTQIATAAFLSKALSRARDHQLFVTKVEKGPDLKGIAHPTKMTSLQKKNKAMDTNVPDWAKDHGSNNKPEELFVSSATIISSAEDQNDKDNDRRRASSKTRRPRKIGVTNMDQHQPEWVDEDNDQGHQSSAVPWGD